MSGHPQGSFVIVDKLTEVNHVISSLSTLNWLTFARPVDAQAPATPPFAGAPLKAILDAAVAAGFGSVGLDGVAVGSLLDSRDGRERVAGMLASRGLACTDVGVLRVGQSDGRVAAEQLGELAAGVGAPVCGAIIDAPLTPGVVDDLAACCDILAEFGVRLALEFMAFGPLGTLGDALEIAEAIGWQRCGLLLDSWHLFHSGAPWAMVAAMDASQIALVQVSDGASVIASPAEFFASSRWGRRLPGDGALDFAGFASALAATGYDGPVSAEVLGFGAAAATPLEAARAIRASLARTFPAA